MSDLTSINTPQGLADWFATNPPQKAQWHALTDLIDDLGYDRGIRVWRDGSQLADARRGESLPALRAATFVRLEGGE